MAALTDEQIENVMRYGKCRTCGSPLEVRSWCTIEPGGPEVLGEPTIGGAMLIVCPTGCGQHLPSDQDALEIAEFKLASFREVAAEFHVGSLPDDAPQP